VILIPPEMQAEPAPPALRVSAARPATLDLPASVSESLAPPGPLVLLVAPEIQIQPQTSALPVIQANEELPDQQGTPAPPERKARRAKRVSKARPVHSAQLMTRVQPDLHWSNPNLLVQSELPAPLLQPGRVLPYRVR
jgi:hypothetical protein